MQVYVRYCQEAWLLYSFPRLGTSTWIVEMGQVAALPQIQQGLIVPLLSTIVFLGNDASALPPILPIILAADKFWLSGCHGKVPFDVMS